MTSMSGLLVPPAGKEKKEFPALVKHEFTIKDKTDIVFWSGLIRVTTEPRLRLGLQKEWSWSAQGDYLRKVGWRPSQLFITTENMWKLFSKYHTAKVVTWLIWYHFGQTIVPPIFFRYCCFDCRLSGRCQNSPIGVLKSGGKSMRSILEALAQRGSSWKDIALSKKGKQRRGTLSKIFKRNGIHLIWKEISCAGKTNNFEYKLCYF